MGDGFCRIPQSGVEREERDMKRILVVEPYYGGSHKQFLKGLQRHIKEEFVFLTLPARKWKMRMQLSAPWFASCIKIMPNKHFDRVLCSTFVDVAVLKALLTPLKNWNSECEFCTYFHENQFAYPLQHNDQSTHQFTAINFTTAMVSDRLAFNSNYNLNSFLENCSKYVKKAADIDIRNYLEEIEKKSVVIYPGIDFEEFLSHKRVSNKTPVIIWNHRWEHDKNPEDFFSTIAELIVKGYDFKITVLGESFRDVPQIFADAQKEFSHNIEHFGYAESRDEYIARLKQGDIVVSTAKHEFFGISILEAIHAGCHPVVPNRLSYPELYPGKYIYREGALTQKLAGILDDLKDGKLEFPTIKTDRFSWLNLLPQYQNWLLGDKNWNTLVGSK